MKHRKDSYKTSCDRNGESYETLRNNWCKISNMFSLYKKLHPGNLTLDTKNCCFGKCISGWQTSRTSIDSSLNYTKRRISDENSAFFRRFLDGALVRTLQRKRSLCSRNIITVKGFVEIWKFKVIEVSRWAYDVLLLKLKLRVAIWLEDVFSPASKKILPRVPRKYEFNPKKPRPDGLHTTIPSRSSTCQQNVPWSQKVSP